MNAKPYPEYKESGVQWLGQVPEHWEVWKLSHGFQNTGSGTTPPSDNDAWYDGDIPWVTTAELRESIIFDTTKKVSEDAITTFSALKLFPEGALAIAMYGATIGRLGILGVPATTNQACCVMYGERALNARFMFLWFQAFREQVILLATGGGQPNISQDKIRSIRVVCPPLPEQTAIATYLDRETGRIDGLVAKKRRLIELLKEKRTALVSRTVTRGLPSDAAREFGLEPHTRFKASGIDWLGEVPEGWEVWKLSHGFQNTGSGTTPPSDNDAWYDGDIPWVTTSELRESIIYETSKNVSVDTIATFSALKLFPEGSLAIAMYGATIGRLGILGVPATTNQACCVMYGERALNARFMFLWFQAFREQVILLATGGGQPNISQEKIRSIRVACPSISEQTAIATYLDRETSKIDRLVEKVEAAVGRLQEYRTALITAAVTGKIDVRGWGKEHGRTQTGMDGHGRAWTYTD